MLRFCCVDAGRQAGRIDTGHGAGAGGFFLALEDLGQDMTNYFQPVFFGFILFEWRSVCVHQFHSLR